MGAPGVDSECLRTGVKQIWRAPGTFNCLLSAEIDAQSDKKRLQPQFTLFYKMVQYKNENVTATCFLNCYFANISIMKYRKHFSIKGVVYTSVKHGTINILCCYLWSRSKIKSESLCPSVCRCLGLCHCQCGFLSHLAIARAQRAFSTGLIIQLSYNN